MQNMQELALLTPWRDVLQLLQMLFRARYVKYIVTLFRAENPLFVPLNVHSRLQYRFEASGGRTPDEIVSWRQPVYRIQTRCKMRQVKQRHNGMNRLGHGPHR